MHHQFFLILEIFFFDTEMRRSKFKKNVVIMVERGACILRAGSNQSYPSSNWTP
jgi:hypothetical protein